jgi:predicted nucleic acid-binding protein
MAYDPPVVVYDANVLYPFHLRNLLVQCAVDRLVAARWTDEIHDEWIRNLVANTENLTRARLEKTRDIMNRVLPDATVTGYAKHLGHITLPDADDRHVVAAAIESGASTIVTWNTRDFPQKELNRHGLRKQRPDAFLLDLYATRTELMVAVAAGARNNLTRSGLSVPEFLSALKKQKIVRFAKVLEGHNSEL